MNSIDLFAGAGGLSMGMEEAGFNVVWALDNEKKTKETFEENHSAEMMVEDIRKINPKDIDIGYNKEDIQVVTGGPPCPTFSLVGRSKINSFDDRDNTEDKRHQLYQDYLRFVDYYEPKVLVMENVKGMMSAENEEGNAVVEVIQSEMEELGYTVDFQVLNSADFGVPQKRERLFFIGNNMDKKNPDLTDWKSHREPKDNEEKEISFKDSSNLFPNFEKNMAEKSPWNTVADAILDLPPVVSDGDTPPKTIDRYTMDAVSQYQEWVRDIPDDKEWEDMELHNHTCRGHNMRDLTLYKLMGEGVTYKIGDLPEEHQPYRTDIFPDKMKKQNPKEPSSTVVAHLYKDGHMFVHPNEARSITVREAARLQSFKDTFEFPVARTHAYKQVGNAVPPLLAQAIGTAIKTELL
jgi:DNA (cytosine-5)-methyltransferase 1